MVDSPSVPAAPPARQRSVGRRTRPARPRRSPRKLAEILPVAEKFGVFGVVNIYGYRYYHPELGRWISKDPIGERGGLNLYAFVGNQSIYNFDIFGNCSGKFKFLHKLGLNLSAEDQKASGQSALSGYEMSFEMDSSDKTCDCCDKIVLKQVVKSPNGSPHFDVRNLGSYEKSNKDTKGGTRPPGYLDGGGHQGDGNDTSYQDVPYDPTLKNGQWKIEVCAYCISDVNFGGAISALENIIGCVSFTWEQDLATRRGWTDPGKSTPLTGEDGWEADPSAPGKLYSDVNEAWKKNSGK